MNQAKFDKTAATESDLRDRIVRSIAQAKQMENEDRDSPSDQSLIERLRRHAAVCQAELARRGLT